MMSLTLTDIIAFYLIPLILAISVHEWAHAAVTTWLGDDTALVRGRVTLNPVSHSDPMWTVIIPTLGLYMGGFFIAAGKPVPYNPAGWRRTLWGRPLQRKWGEFLVAGAGPASNLVQALLAAILLAVVVQGSGVGVEQAWEASHSVVREGGALVMISVLGRFIFINALLAVFNLIPVPPLDGAKVIGAFLPGNIGDKLNGMGMMGFLALIVLVFHFGHYLSLPIHGLTDGMIALALGL